jgi:predicted small secreted protein
MALLWQQIIIGAAVAAAIAYLVVRYLRKRKQQAICANCTLLKLAQQDDKPAGQL